MRSGWREGMEIGGGRERGWREGMEREDRERGWRERG
jgi:hypothetical protein